MPPESPQPESAEPSREEHEDNTEQLIAERIEESRKFFGKLYEEGVVSGTDPRTRFLRETNEQSVRELYGDEKIEALQESVRALTWTTREEFVEGMLALTLPFHRARYADPEVRARAEAVHQREEESDVGALQLRIRRSDVEVTLEDGTQIALKDPVVELTVVGKDAVPGPKEILHSLQAVAAFLEMHPYIVAVVGVSWMMKRRLVRRLGFQVIESVDISERQKEKIADTAEAWRNDREYQREVTPGDVAYGAMSREAFLRRYSSPKQTIGSKDAEGS
ncbi:MAG: hypothetical protein V1778_02590 [bacterium]